jgi:hypothetical protein
MTRILDVRLVVGRVRIDGERVEIPATNDVAAALRAVASEIDNQRRKT